MHCVSSKSFVGSCLLCSIQRARICFVQGLVLLYLFKYDLMVEFHFCLTLILCQEISHLDSHVGCLKLTPDHRCQDMTYMQGVKDYYTSLAMSGSLAINGCRHLRAASCLHHSLSGLSLVREIVNRHIFYNILYLKYF